MREIIVDSFAGGGGASLGIELALGRSPDIAVNHDAAALAMHAANHPETLHVQEDVWKADLRKLTKRRPVGLLWASPDCRHFSRAKGSKPVSKSVRSLAWIVCKWAAQVRPRVIILENVREFEEWGPLVGDRPCPRRKGLTFRRFVGRLKNLGYAVEWKHLDAADFGAPTRRRRLFLVARRDGEPIVWPEPTHADPSKLVRSGLFTEDRKPWRTAAECIDWSLPCPSIFDREKPLAEKTLRRIALGIKRYVLDAAEPFLVQVNHGGEAFRGGDLDGPMPTLSQKHGFGVVEPFIVGTGGPEGSAKPVPANRPLGSIIKQSHRAIVAPSLVTVGYGEREGQQPRVPGLEHPLGTVVSGGGKHALVAAWIVKHFGGMVGKDAEAPLPTTTVRGTQNQLGAACLVRFNHGDKQWNAVEEPLGTVTTQGNKFALVAAFLVKYFETAIGAPLAGPLPTATQKARFGLVEMELAPGVKEPAIWLNVAGVGPCLIADIGLRMLTPRELARAQGFPDAYDLEPKFNGKPLTKTNQVAKIGNSVCPPVAAAMVAANYVPDFVPAVHV